jgi:hypothetical protein
MPPPCDVSDESAQRIGHQLGAQSIVSGSLTNLGDAYRFRVKVINVETARIETQVSYDMGNDQRVTFLLQGSQQTAPAVATTTPTATAGTGSRTLAPAASAKEYKIGDTGPAGGIVFYDKGYSSDGWRYLEAASRDIGSGGIQWSASSVTVDKTNTVVGTGKQNSELIQKSGESISAAMAVLHYSQGGYNDWFLPSRDELAFMYSNLKQKKLGGFSDDWYWSSSMDGSYVWHQRFSDGNQDYSSSKSTTNMVKRACKAWRSLVTSNKRC